MADEYETTREIADRWRHPSDTSPLDALRRQVAHEQKREAHRRSQAAVFLRAYDRGTITVAELGWALVEIASTDIERGLLYAFDSGDLKGDDA